MSFWEENKDGGLGIAVILANDATPAGFAHEDAPGGKGNGNNLLLVKARDGVPLRYFTGAGWTKSGQFDGRAAWESYVKEFAARAQQAADRHRECEPSEGAEALVVRHGTGSLSRRRRVRAEQIFRRLAGGHRARAKSASAWPSASSPRRTWR